jgi:large subunit ribosomal protein L3
MFGFGKKIGMTTLFIDDQAVSVTAIEFGEQIVLQQKTKEKDGYDAVQVSFGKRRKARKSFLGHTKKYSDKEFNPLLISEFKIDSNNLKKEYSITDFSVGDTIDLTGTTKGKGYTGVVKRYNFGGQPASHGHEHKKARGSIGAMYPQRVIPGTRMAGREGNKNLTIKNMKVVAIDEDNNLLFVKGSVPGSNGNFVKIKKIIK